MDIIEEEVIESINNEEFDASKSMKFKIEQYEGPLFLLLDLVKERKIEIKDIKLADITEQYLIYIRNMEGLDMEKATEFLAVATVLLEIKSRSLLPQDEVEIIEDEENPEEVLKKQLELLSLFQEASNKLQAVENVNHIYKEPDKSAGDARIIFNEFNYENLLDAFAIVLSKSMDRENPIQIKKIEKDRWTVAEKIASLKSILKETPKINFFELFDDNYSKLEIITLFLAILELLKFQQIQVVQENKFSDITIIAKENIKDEIE